MKKKDWWEIFEKSHLIKELHLRYLKSSPKSIMNKQTNKNKDKILNRHFIKEYGEMANTNEQV
jgi:hypothetical protein